MARTIDWSKPLSDEDRAWAAQRGDQQFDGKSFNQLISENDVEHGKEAKDSKKSRAERMDDLRSSIADAENELSRLQQEQVDEDNRNAALAGSLGDQAKGLIVRDNTPVNGETPEGSSTQAENYSDEKYWTKAKLSEEIDRRNADGAELSKTGSRAELVERLRQDDEELARG